MVRKQLHRICNPHTATPCLVDWLLIAALSALCYFSFNHGDLICTATHGKDLLECTFAGNFLGFYDYTQATAVYDITIYLLFAVWSLPIWLIYQIAGIPLWGVLDYGAVPYPVMLWYKLLPTLFFAGIAYLLIKITEAMHFDTQTGKWIAFLFVASPVAIFSQFIFGQYDAFGLFFTVWALYLFIRKRLTAFSVCCAVAITFKMFALFFFLPLLLLAEKRLLHLIRHCLIAVSGYVLTNLLFFGSPGYHKAMGFSGNILPRLFQIGINTEMGTVSFFTVAMMVLCVVAYITKPETDTDFFAYAIYLPLAAFACLFAFVTWHPQWVLFAVPFLALSFLLTPNTNASLILYTALSVGYLAISVLCHPNNVDINLFGLGAFSRIYAAKTLPSLGGVYSLNGLVNNNPYYSLFAGSLLILLGLYFPNAKCLKRFHIRYSEGTVAQGDRFFRILYPLSLFFFLFPAFFWLLTK